VALVEAAREYLAGRAESRGSAMTPIQWIFASLIGGIVGASRAGLGDVLLSVLMALLTATLLFFFVTYAIWMKIDPDALRSERYALRREELRRGLVGDNQAGLHRPPRRRRRDTVPETEVTGA
jgi:hypothetical protein